MSDATLLIVSDVTLADSISLVSHLNSTIQACTPLSSSCHQERLLHVVWLPMIGKWAVLLCIAIVRVDVILIKYFYLPPPQFGA